MGLDMYAYAIPKSVVTREIGFRLSDHPDARPFHYWRKHPDLHGWMEELYVAKGGTAEFNCEPLVLTAADIDALEQVILNRELPATTGFFFGESDGSERDDDLAFIAAARDLMADDYAVLYDSWW